MEAHEARTERLELLMMYSMSLNVQYVPFYALRNSVPNPVASRYSSSIVAVAIVSSTTSPCVTPLPPSLHPKTSNDIDRRAPQGIIHVWRPNSPFT